MYILFKKEIECTISVILFLAAFNVILEYVRQAGLPRHPLWTRKSMPVLCAFMDAVSLETTLTPASKIALQKTVVALKWAMTKLKPQKSRSLVIKGGKTIHKQPFQVAGEIIPSIRGDWTSNQIFKRRGLDRNSIFRGGMLGKGQVFSGWGGGRLKFSFRK